MKHSLFEKIPLQKKIVALSAFLVLILLVYWLLEMTQIYDVKELEMEVYVDRIVGVNVDTDKIYFGTVAPGGSSTRAVTMTAGPYRSLVTIQYTGDISEWVSVSDNNFVVEANQSMRVDVQVKIPENTDVPGYRKGVLRIVFRRI